MPDNHSLYVWIARSPERKDALFLLVPNEMNSSIIIC